MARAAHPAFTVERPLYTRKRSPGSREVLIYGPRDLEPDQTLKRFDPFRDRTPGHPRDPGGDSQNGGRSASSRASSTTSREGHHTTGVTGAMHGTIG